MRPETKILIAKTFKQQVEDDPSILSNCPEEFFIVLSAAEDEEGGYKVQPFYIPMSSIASDDLRRRVMNLRSTNAVPFAIQAEGKLHGLFLVGSVDEVILAQTPAGSA